jgi:hypothetical protein
VVVSAEVEYSVHDRFGEVASVLGADHDVAELARPGGKPALVDRKRQHVGGTVDPAVLAVELADPIRVDERDGEVPLLDSGRSERGEGGPAKQLRGIDQL